MLALSANCFRKKSSTTRQSGTNMRPTLRASSDLEDLTPMIAVTVAFILHGPRSGERHELSDFHRRPFFRRIIRDVWHVLETRTDVCAFLDTREVEQDCTTIIFILLSFSQNGHGRDVFVPVETSRTLGVRIVHNVYSSPISISCSSWSKSVYSDIKSSHSFMSLFISCRVNVTPIAFTLNLAK